MVNHQNIVEKLLQEGQKTELYFSALTEPEFGICVYLDEQKWQIRDVLAHFISAEKSFLVLFDNINNHGEGSPEDFSINDFNNSQVEKMKNIVSADLLELFRETRAQTVKWVNGLTEEDMEKTGRHPAMGEAKLWEMIKMIYLHNQMHLRDLRSSISMYEGNQINLNRNNTDK
jgi:hypothetical protein